VLRDCCNGEARVLLNDHFQARIGRNRELYEAVEAENLQLETQTRVAGNGPTTLMQQSWRPGSRPRPKRRRRRHPQQCRPQPLERGLMAPHHRRRHPSQRAEPPQRPCPRFNPLFTMSHQRTTSQRSHHFDGRLRPA
jgi:hypothetical protein